ncbi:MAG: hypothetical protein PGN21_13010 [Sphingomonas paucimobilis]
MLAWLLVAAQAGAPTVENDLRCIASISQSLAAAKAEQRPVLTAGMAYFVGRVDAASPSTDIGAAVERIQRAPGAKAALDAAALPCAERIMAKSMVFARLDRAVTRIEQPR